MVTKSNIKSKLTSTEKSGVLYTNSNRPVYKLFQSLLVLGGMPEIAVMNPHGLFEHADPEVLHDIANSAATLQRTLHLGNAAVGRCLALASPDAMDSDQCSPATVEAIGWLLGELSDLSALCHHFEATARRTLLVQRPP